MNFEKEKTHPASVPEGPRKFAAFESSLHQFLQNLPEAIYTCDKSGHVTFFNDAAAKMWGRAPTLGEDTWCGSYRIFRLDGTRLPHEYCPMAIAIKENRNLKGEALLERPDGSRSHFLASPHPIRNRFGDLVGAINLLVVISEGEPDDELAKIKQDMAFQVSALARLHELALQPH